jgi:hypothetical protein
MEKASPRLPASRHSSSELAKTAESNERSSTCGRQSPGMQLHEKGANRWHNFIYPESLSRALSLSLSLGPCARGGRSIGAHTHTQTHRQAETYARGPQRDGDSDSARWGSGGRLGGSEARSLEFISVDSVRSPALCPTLASSLRPHARMPHVSASLLIPGSN